MDDFDKLFFGTRIKTLKEIGATSLRCLVHEIESSFSKDVPALTMYSLAMMCVSTFLASAHGNIYDAEKLKKHFFVMIDEKVKEYREAYNG